MPLVAVTEKRHDAAEQILQQYHVLEKELNVKQLLDSPSALIGTVDQIVEDLLERRERYGFSYIVVWEPMDQFIPVVERLAGK